MTLRFQFVPDRDFLPHTPNGDPLPGTRAEYEAAPILVDGAPLSWAEYRVSYGHPDRQVVLGCVLERYCAACGGWLVVASLWGIWLYDMDPELRVVPIGQNLVPEDIRPSWGYLGAVARELIAEVA